MVLRHGRDATTERPIQRLRICEKIRFTRTGQAIRQDEPEGDRSPETELHNFE